MRRRIQPPLVDQPPGARRRVRYFRDEVQLKDFQALGTARWVLNKSLLCTWDTGTGKSMLALAGISQLFSDEAVDVAWVICEQNKITEWVADFETHTRLRVLPYRGTPAKRAKIRESIGTPDGPQVLVTTYETSRNDLGKMAKKSKTFTEGPLIETMLAQRGVALVYDEVSRLGNRYEKAHYNRSVGAYIPARGSVTYKAHETLLGQLRASECNLWVAGLTATKIERSPENYYNIARLLDPKLVPSVKKFNEDYVTWRDAVTGRASYCNISPTDLHRHDWVTPLSEVIAPLVDYKSKLDPDVRREFPTATEEPIVVELSKDHRELYDAVDAIGSDPELFPDGMSEAEEQVMFTVLRQVAAHPGALALSPSAQEPGTIANLIVSKVGADRLAEIGSAKLDVLVDRLKPLVKGQGAQVVVFTFFGRSVLPLLQARLIAEGFTVAPYHGGLSDREKEANRTGFRSGDFEILLSSDAGARGLNIPEAQYVVNYELCLTHAKTVQRVNRISRMGSGHGWVTAYSMVAADTIEEQILGLNLQRQSWEEQLTESGDSTTEGDGGGEGMTVQERRSLFAAAGVS